MYELLILHAYFGGCLYCLWTTDSAVKVAVHGIVCLHRDVSIHAASAEAKNVDDVVGLLADVVMRPLFTEDEVSSSAVSPAPDRPAERQIGWWLGIRTLGQYFHLFILVSVTI